MTIAESGVGICAMVSGINKDSFVWNVIAKDGQTCLAYGNESTRSEALKSARASRRIIVDRMSS